MFRRLCGCWRCSRCRVQSYCTGFDIAFGAMGLRPTCALERHTAHADRRLPAHFFATCELSSTGSHEPPASCSGKSPAGIHVWCFGCRPICNRKTTWATQRLLRMLHTDRQRFTNLRRHFSHSTRTSASTRHWTFSLRRKSCLRRCPASPTNTRQTRGGNGATAVSASLC